MALRVDAIYPPVGSYEDRFPYDPRGCCWPWGPCGRRKRLEVRCTLIGERAAGPIDPDYGAIATGMLAGIDPNVSDYLTTYFFDTNGAIAYALTLIIDAAEAEGPWYGDVYIQSYVPGFTDLHAAGEMASAYCLTGGDLLLVDSFTGPAAAPDFIRIKSLPWFLASPYPE